MTRSSLHLITGGARSGKSRNAHLLALKLGVNRIFVATAQAYDGEMQQRIELHQSERGDAYRTIEASRDLPGSLSLLEDRVDVILIDCLTLWISNLLFEDLNDAEITKRILSGLDIARQKASHVILVSNEVGFGIVPENALARRFRDLNGRLQQLIAASADTLYLACMGRVLPLHHLGLSFEESL